MGSSLPTQIAAIAQRSVIRTMRQPAVIISALLFPMMFFSINAYGLDAAIRIPGFPADSYMDFAFAFPLIQASLFGAGVAMLMRTQQAGPVIRTPIFMVLFLAPVFVPLNLLQGWIDTIARLNPFTPPSSTPRGFLAGEPTSSLPAYAIEFALVLAFALWAHFGLRRAEKAG
jgi:ABC-type polysaccharide/polyol phosphate export permease